MTLKLSYKLNLINAWFIEILKLTVGLYFFFPDLAGIAKQELQRFIIDSNEAVELKLGKNHTFNLSIMNFILFFTFFNIF